MSRRLQSDSFSKKKQRKSIGLVVITIVAILLLCTGIFFLTHWHLFIIDNVEVFGADSDISNDLKTGAENTLQGSYLFGFIPHANTIFYPKNNIISNLKQISPRVEDVAVKRDGLHSLIITIGEKSPAAIVCDGLPDWNGAILVTEKSDQCYLVDNSGFIFNKITNVCSSDSCAVSDLTPNHVFYTSGVNVGSYLASTTKFASLLNVFNETRSAGIPSIAMLVKDNGEYELYANTVIYFNDSANIKDEIENLILFWKNKKGNYSDIKLQYPPNVYYSEIK